MFCNQRKGDQHISRGGGDLYVPSGSGLNSGLHSPEGGLLTCVRECRQACVIPLTSGWLTAEDSYKQLQNKLYIFECGQL